MKKLFLIIASVTISYAIVYSQGCLPEGIVFSTQAQIDSFAINYPNCTEIEGYVAIGCGWEDTTDITNLNGLTVLTSLGSSLSIGAWDLVFPYNLTSLSGLNNIVSIGGYLEICGTQSLTNLTGLENLTTIGGSLWIYWNTALTSLTGLEGLTSVPGGLGIIDNYALTNLTGLANVSSIGGDLRITGNPALTSLTGLDNIDAGSIASLQIYSNYFLSTCEVQSVCDYLASPGGTISIYGNATGCNSQEEIEAACLTIVEERRTGNRMTIIPNPSNDKITVSVPNGVTIDEVLIYNQTGQKVLHGNPENETLNFSHLQNGMYIIELITNQGRIREKLIVQ